MATIEVPLTRGLVALIDDEDQELVGQYTWHAAQRDRTIYAASMGIRRFGYYMHRLIAGAKPGEHVDHRNGEGLDNRRANLRICTNAENRRNMRKTRGVSRFKGVARCRTNTGRPWHAYIWMHNRKINLGNYPTEIDAARAYNAASIELHGAFSRINEIEGLTYEESVTAPVRNHKPGRPFSRERLRTAGPAIGV